MRFKSKRTGQDFNFVFFDSYDSFSTFLNAWGIPIGVTIQSDGSAIVAVTLYIDSNYPAEIMIGEWFGFTDDLRHYDILPNLEMINRFYEMDPGYRYPDELINRAGHLLRKEKQDFENTQS